MNDFIKMKKNRAEKENELLHYGVKGMKWGVVKDPDNKDRKDVSIDAEYNEKDKVKAVKPINTDKNKAAIAGGSKVILDGIKGISDSSSKLFEGKKAVDRFYKTYPDISDKELSEKLNRIRMERQYSDLVGDTKVVKTGSEKAKDILQTVGAVAGVGASIASIIYAIYAFKSGSKI